ncbi:alpha-1,2-fucosyltransferase [Francisella sp. SYW-2]|uniref:alpha-1,2-fucosyltransferase n=1 Tax=Francisella sp. SYW-2 TaxID=2610886 RepID=UPI00123D89CE|nr:alpha-1,2-fucosyltransferase [Francisella sp. SYW-2]
MIIVKLTGGLGNQMFQYAFYKALQTQIKSDVYIDITGFKGYKLHNGYELSDVFELFDGNFSNTKIMKKLFGIAYYLGKFNKRFLTFSKKYITQKDFGYSESYFSVRSCYLNGYWQSEKYFVSIGKDIRKLFEFKKLDSNNQNIIAGLQQSYSLVSIHIRRGDYVNHPLHGNVCDLNYYNEAIKYISNKISNVQFLVFSDDIQWCKQNLKLTNAVYVTGNKGKNSYKDMQIMSLCNHNIIANSSFSWWGAWLNQNSNKIVIAPKKWFSDDRINQRDICPISWVRI